MACIGNTYRFGSVAVQLFCWVVLTLSYASATAQIQMPRLEWAAVAGQDSSCNGNAICTDAGSNAFVASFFQGAIDADPGPGAAPLAAVPGGTAMLQKLDANGNLLWVRQFGGTGLTGTNALALDGSGNIYIAGAFEGQADFDPGPGVQSRNSSGGWDAYVLTLDATGGFLWVVTVGSAGTDWAYGLQADAAGNVWVTGELGGLADFDPGPGVLPLTPNGARSAYLWNLSAIGGLGWAGQITGNGAATGRGVDIDASGNVLWCGNFSGTLDFDPGIGQSLETSAGMEDGFLVKLNAGGNLLWKAIYGGIDDDHVENVAVGANGFVYVGGDFRDTVDFDPSSTGSFPLVHGGSQSAFLTQLDTNGGLRWAVNIPTSNVAQGKVMQVDSVGGVYLEGYCWGNVDFDPSPSTAFTLNAGNGSDAFLLKLGANGAFGWAGLLDGPGAENMHALALDGSAGVWMTGNITQTTDFDPSTGNYTLGLADGRLFVTRWTQCTPPLLSITDTFCTGFTTHGHFFNQNGHHWLRIPGPGPCDSLMELNLTFEYQRTDIYQSFCYPDTINGQIYNFPGTYVQVMQSAQLCDSVLYYHLTGNPYYRYLPPVFACGQYTHRGVTHLGSGTYYVALAGPSSNCDTVEVLQLLLHHDSATLLTVNSCGPFSLNTVTYVTIRQTPY